MYYLPWSNISFMYLQINLSVLAHNNRMNDTCKFYQMFSLVSFNLVSYKNELIDGPYMINNKSNFN